MVSIGAVVRVQMLVMNPIDRLAGKTGSGGRLDCDILAHLHPPGVNAAAAAEMVSHSTQSRLLGISVIHTTAGILYTVSTDKTGGEMSVVVEVETGGVAAVGPALLQDGVRTAEPGVGSPVLPAGQHCLAHGTYSSKGYERRGHLQFCKDWLVAPLARHVEPFPGVGLPVVQLPLGPVVVLPCCVCSTIVKTVSGEYPV